MIYCLELIAINKAASGPLARAHAWSTGLSTVGEEARMLVVSWEEDGHSGMLKFSVSF